MQTIRTRVLGSVVLQQIRFAGSSTKGGKQSDPSKGSDLNKSKGGDKKGKTTQVDDTKQPGVTRKDWSRPDQTTNNDPQYGKGGKPNSK